MKRGARGPALRVAVVGAGWAGLAAAVRLVQAGCRVTLHETAAEPGGRARRVDIDGQPFDNGQHILIGAYQRTLDLMRSVGVYPDDVLARMPLALLDARGVGLRLPPGPAMLSFARGVLAHRSWPLADRLVLLAEAGRWLAQGFRCDPDEAVFDRCRRLPAIVRRDLVEPLCVAALNTEAPDASMAVFLRVLRDGLFSGPGAADLLLPRRDLGTLLPHAAVDWLRQRGARVRLGQRVMALDADRAIGPDSADEAPNALQRHWRVDDEPHDAVVLACSAAEAARLTQGLAPDWSALARGFGYEPIATAWYECDRLDFAYPMLALREGPAQFAFDLQRLHGARGRLSLVVSGARRWSEAGRAALCAALEDQIRDELAPAAIGEPRLVRLVIEKRATFRCTPNLQRPTLNILPGLVAAGDYIAGPYPATLEGAVRAGEAAAATLTDREAG